MKSSRSSFILVKFPQNFVNFCSKYIYRLLKIYQKFFEDFSSTSSEIPQILLKIRVQFFDNSCKFFRNITSNLS